MGSVYDAIGVAMRAGDRLMPRNWPALASADALIAEAGVRPEVSARAGLVELLAAIAADSELSLFGKLSLRWDMIRLLRNAQLVEDAHAANPALGAAPVEAPLFILGLPRSGTSFLHGLLAEDPQSYVPRLWQTIYPAPRPAGFDAARDKRARQVDQQLKIFSGLAPGFASAHPIMADSPQECSEITAHVFQSLRFDTTFRVPGYMSWLTAHGHDDAFAYHKRFLQFLQGGTKQRWVLKCPDHTFSLDAIVRTYPDARFVIVHRDPVAVLGSVAHLTQILRTPFIRNIDPAEIGAQVASRWTEGAHLLLAFDQRADIPAARKLHLHYDDVTSAPLAAAGQIYETFGLEFTDAARAAMRRRLDEQPRGGYGSHAPYALADYKISTAAVRNDMAPYLRQFCRDLS